VAGVVQPTSGELFIGGAAVSPRTPNEAQKLGVAMVFQETSLVPTMTVAQNLFLGQERFFNRLRGSKIEGFFETMAIDQNIYVGLLAKFRAGRRLVSAAERRSLGQRWVKELGIRASARKPG
jgi:ABC-type sugar transport system ATPase subunit